MKNISIFSHLLNSLKSAFCSEIPEWLTDVSSWHGHIPFAFAVIPLLQPRVFVELGTHKGDSYCAFCQAVKDSESDCVCYAVDTWEGDEQAGLYGPEILNDLRAHHDSRYGHFSTLLKMRFDDALSHFSDGAIDLLHIDGLHTYEAVRHDFEAWLPKMSAQGVVLLHDTNVHEGDFGVWKLWQEISGKFPAFEFLHSNGLGILGVGKELPDGIQNFLDIDHNMADDIRSLFNRLGDNITRIGQIRTLENRLKEQDSYNRELEREVEKSCAEVERQGAYTRELEQKVEEVHAEAERRSAYNRELEQKVEEVHAEAERRGAYTRELEQKMEDIRNHFEQRGEYIQELEQRVEEIHGNFDRRGEYIQELGQTVTELKKRLDAFEGSSVCTTWLKAKGLIERAD